MLKISSQTVVFVVIFIAIASIVVLPRLSQLLNRHPKRVSPASAETQVLKEKDAQGDAEAQYKLGLAYYEGTGRPQDRAKAAEWFERAAEQGNVSAQLVFPLTSFCHSPATHSRSFANH